MRIVTLPPVRISVDGGRVLREQFVNPGHEPCVYYLAIELVGSGSHTR